MSNEILEAQRKKHAELIYQLKGQLEVRLEFPLEFFRAQRKNVDWTIPESPNDPKYKECLSWRYLDITLSVLMSYGLEMSQAFFNEESFYLMQHTPPLNDNETLQELI